MFPSQAIKYHLQLIQSTFHLTHTHNQQQQQEKNLFMFFSTLFYNPSNYLMSFFGINLIAFLYSLSDPHSIIAAPPLHKNIHFYMAGILFIARDEMSVVDVYFPFIVMFYLYGQNIYLLCNAVYHIHNASHHVFYVVLEFINLS